MISFDEGLNKVINRISEELWRESKHMALRNAEHLIGKNELRIRRQIHEKIAQE